MDVRPDTERRLIEEAQRGDAARFDQLVAPYSAALGAELRRLVGDSATAEELLQDTLFRAWRSLPRYRHVGRFEGWLRRMAQNIAVDELRRRAARIAISYVECVPEPPSTTTPQHLLEARDAQVRFEEIFESLPPEQREVVLLRHVTNLTFREIAARQRVSLNTALGRMHSARKKLLNAFRALLPRLVGAGAVLAMAAIVMQQSRLDPDDPPSGIAVDASAGLASYTSERDGQTDVYVLELVNRRERRITDDPRPESWPSISPDLNQVFYFARDDALWTPHVTNLGTMRTQPVDVSLPHDEFPAAPSGTDWHPDGDRVAFSIRTRIGVFQVFELNLRSKRVQQLTFGPLDSQFARYSSDGARLYFVRNRPQYATSAEIWTAGSNGAFPRPLTRTPRRAASRHPTPTLMGGAPGLVFQRTREPESSLAADNWLMIMGLDGGNPVPVRARGVPGSILLAIGDPASTSLLVSTRVARPPEPVGELWLVNSDGSSELLAAPAEQPAIRWRHGDVAGAQ